MTNAPSKAAIAKARALVLAETDCSVLASGTTAFARYIDDHPEEPQVDPDLLTAREAVALRWDGHSFPIEAAAIRAGNRDDSHAVQIALAAIKLSKERGE